MKSTISFNNNLILNVSLRGSHVIIIVMVVSLLFGTNYAFADLQVSGTTISGSSDSDTVLVIISDSDGQVIWKKSVSVDETFEITMPRLEEGRYTLSIKHGAIGGELEVIEFTYTGPTPIGNFELIIELPEADAEDFDSFATKNRINNFERLMNFIRDSEEVERRLEVIIIKFDDERGISSQDVSAVTRFTPDGLETLEYGTAWTTFRAYNDIIGDAKQILRLVEDGMSLDTAINFLGIIPIPEPTPEPTPEPELKELGIASFVDKSKDPQSYIDRYNSEPEYKKWFHENYPQYDSIEQAVGLELTEKIPSWVKNIFLWYGQDQVSEDELLNAIKYLIDEGILVVN